MAAVLLLEDEEPVRVFAAGIIREMGHKILTAASIGEALALLSAEEPIDLLFISLRLWGDREAGLRLAREAVKLRPNIPVLYTTRHGVTNSMRAMFVERFTFLAKPYAAYQLKRAIGDILARLGLQGIRRNRT